jgi:hypothetical protein
MRVDRRSARRVRRRTDRSEAPQDVRGAPGGAALYAAGRPMRAQSSGRAGDEARQTCRTVGAGRQRRTSVNVRSLSIDRQRMLPSWTAR